MNLRNRVEKLEGATKIELTTVKGLVDFVLRVQQGQASIHSATVGTPLLGIDPNGAESRQWLKVANDIAAKHNKPVEEVKNALIARKPELAKYLC